MIKILIVDEDTDVLRLLRIKLNAAGYAVVRARDGQEALAALDQEAPDMVIMELLLPDVNGIGLIAQMAARPSAPQILVLSSRATDEAIAASLTLGASDYVTKPFSPQALLERIRVNLIRAAMLAPTPMEG